MVTAGMGAAAGSGLRDCPAGAARPAGSPRGPRRAAPPARWALCPQRELVKARRSSRVLERSAGRRQWMSSDGASRGCAAVVCRGRAPRLAQDVRRGRGGGGPAFRLPADFGDHTPFAGRNAAPVGLALSHGCLVVGLLWRGGILASDAWSRLCYDTAPKMINGGGKHGPCCRWQSVGPGLLTLPGMRSPQL